MDSEFVMLITTVDSGEEGKKLVNQVIGEKLAACGHMTGPINSTYFWEGQLTTSQEWECIFKTTHSNLEETKAFIKKHHSYDVPQIVVIPIVDGDSEYLKWIQDSVKS